MIFDRVVPKRADSSWRRDDSRITVGRDGEGNRTRWHSNRLKHRTDGVYISSRGDGVACLVCGVLIYSATCEGPQFSVNNIKHGCVNSWWRGGCNGGGPPFSNSWAEFKRSSLSIIVDHIRLFMAAAHPSAPSCRIMCPKSLNHLRLAPATRHWAHCAPNTPTVILSQHSRTYKEPYSSVLPHNCALKWNPPFLACIFRGFFLWFALKTLGNRVGQNDLRYLSDVCMQQLLLPASCSSSWNAFAFSGLKVEDYRFFCGMHWYIFHWSLIFYTILTRNSIFHRITPPFCPGLHPYCTSPSLYLLWHLRPQWKGSSYLKRHFINNFWPESNT